MLKDLYIRLKKNKTLINGGLFSIFSFICKGSSFFLLIILAKFILPDDYGRLSLFGTVQTFISYFIAFSTAGYMSVAFFKKEFEEFKKDFTAIVLLSILSVGLFSLIAIVVLPFIGDNLGFPNYLLWYAILLSFLTCIIGLYLDYLRIKEQVISYGIVSCGNALLIFVLSIIIVVYLRYGWTGWISARLVADVLFAIIAIFFFFRLKLFKIDFSWIRYKTMLMWGIPLIPHLASVWLRQGGDRYIININNSVYEVGLFSFALNLTSVIIMIGMAFNQTNSVSIYKILSDKSLINKKDILRSQTRNIFYIYLLASLFVSLLMVILVPFVLPQYSGSVPYFGILAFYGFLQCIYFLFCNFLFYFEKTKQLMYVTFGTSLLHLALSIILTRYSLYYTCIIYVVIQALIVFLVTYLSIKYIRESNILANNNNSSAV